MPEPVCHAGRVPCVASLDALHRAVAEFAVTDPGLVIEPSARAAAQRSLDSTGLLLLGEIIRALMQAFGLTRRANPQDKIRLYQHDGELILDLPLATEAVVPQRSPP